MITADVRGQRAALSRTRALLPGGWPLMVVLLAFLGASIAVLPRMSADDSARVTSFELDASQPTPALRLRGASRNVYGFTVDASQTGAASFALPPQPPSGPERTVLFVSAGAGPGVETRVSVIDSAGVRHTVGSPVRWHERRVDVTSLIGSGARLEFTAFNRTAAAALFADRVRVATYRSNPVPRAGRWEVSALLTLAALLGLAVLGRARRDAPLVAGVALTVLLVWPAVVAGALQPLHSDVWDAAVHAGWLDLDNGLVSGTFGPRSHLAVQIFHALTPVTGDGAAGARTASMLVGIAAMIAIYVLARRVTGTAGGIAAIAFTLIADPFRLSLSAGGATGTLVLAACVFLIAVHRALLRPDRRGMMALGATGALAILAQPLWWPGVVASLVVLALRLSPRGARRASLGIALVTLLVVSLPSRVSVAHQSGGDAGADIVETATRARDNEFAGGGHGAAGDRVGLADYVLGERSPWFVVRSVVNGADESLSGAGARPETKLIGLVAFVVQLAGVAFLLLLPRLRLLVVVAMLVALVPWFFVARASGDPFIGASAFWPILPLGGAAIVYAVVEALRRRNGTQRVANAVRGRLSSLSRGTGQRTHRAKS